MRTRVLGILQAGAEGGERRMKAIIRANSSRRTVAALLLAAGTLAGCTDDDNPQAEKITVAPQDTTPPQFAAFVAMENAKQVSPPTTAGATGFSTTVGPGSPAGPFSVYPMDDELAIVVNAFDDESGIQKIEIYPKKGSASCPIGDDDLASTGGPGLTGIPAAPGKNGSVMPGDQVPRVAFGSENVPVRRGTIVEVGMRVTDNYGNSSRANFRVDFTCNAP